MALKMSQKGQAALTDALYFLMLVSIISTMLFFYASNYGLTLQQRVSNQYWREYTTGALETILYSSTPRDPEKSLYAPPDEIEVDHLLLRAGGTSDAEEGRSHRQANQGRSFFIHG